MTFSCVSDKMAHATCMWRPKDTLQESILLFLAIDVNEHRDLQLGIIQRITVFKMLKAIWDVYTTCLSRKVLGSSRKRE